MNTMFYVVLIVAIAGATSVASQYLKGREKDRKAKMDLETGDTQAKLESLEERIKVLERIVTENKFDLRREINKL